MTRPLSFDRRTRLLATHLSTNGPDLHTLAGKLQVIVLLRPDLGAKIDKTFDDMLSHIDLDDFRN